MRPKRCLNIIYETTLSIMRMKIKAIDKHYPLCKWQCENIFCIIAFLFQLLLIMNLLNSLSNMLHYCSLDYSMAGAFGSHTKHSTRNETTASLSLRCQDIFITFAAIGVDIIKLNIKVSAAIRQFASFFSSPCTILNK